MSTAAREKSLERFHHEVKLGKDGHPQVNENDGRRGDDPHNGGVIFCIRDYLTINPPGIFLDFQPLCTI